MTAADVVFQQHELLIYKVVRKFCAQYPTAYTEIEDALADGRLFFWQAYKAYNPARAKLTTWVYIRIWYRLKEKMLQKVRHDPPRKPQQLPDVSYTSSNNCLMADLSHDAQAIVRLILDTPGYVFLDQEIPGRQKRDNAPIVLVYRVCRQLGWKRDRILESFSEIARAL